MGEAMVQIIFGWPAIIMSILLSIAGVWLRKPFLLVTAGIVCIPFSYYLSGYRVAVDCSNCYYRLGACLCCSDTITSSYLFLRRIYAFL